MKTLSQKLASYTRLSTMLSDLMKRFKDALKPYTFEDYVIDSNPQSWSELKELERNWNRYKNDFGAKY